VQIELYFCFQRKKKSLFTPWSWSPISLNLLEYALLSFFVGRSYAKHNYLQRAMGREQLNLCYESNSQSVKTECPTIFKWSTADSDFVLTIAHPRKRMTVFKTMIDFRVRLFKQWSTTVPISVKKKLNKYLLFQKTRHLPWKLCSAHFEFCSHAAKVTNIRPQQAKNCVIQPPAENDEN
jgi:hypothetical protein